MNYTVSLYNEKTRTYIFVTSNVDLKIALDKDTFIYQAGHAYSEENQ